MTFAELLEQLETLNEEQLAQPVTAFVEHSGRASTVELFIEQGDALLPGGNAWLSVQ